MCRSVHQDSALPPDPEITAATSDLETDASYAAEGTAAAACARCLRSAGEGYEYLVARALRATGDGPFRRRFQGGPAPGAFGR